MPFRYRLEKILKDRIRQKEAQQVVVHKAQMVVYEVEERIRQNEAEIQETIKNKRTADFRMMEYYDNYLHHLWDKAEVLEQERKQAQAALDKEKQKLIECEQKVKVLEKHKERKKELYIEEEKKAELKQYSEIGVQRFFMQKRDEAEEMEMELESEQNESEGY
jgi:flagellar export protein FliJ